MVPIGTGEAVAAGARTGEVVAETGGVGCGTAEGRIADDSGCGDTGLVDVCYFQDKEDGVLIQSEVIFRYLNQSISRWLKKRFKIRLKIQIT